MFQTLLFLKMLEKYKGNVIYAKMFKNKPFIIIENKKLFLNIFIFLACVSP